MNLPSNLFIDVAYRIFILQSIATHTREKVVDQDLTGRRQVIGGVK